MSILDLLLETDAEKLQRENSKEYEIKRLSKALGEKFIITCRPLTHEQVGHIGEISKNTAETKLNAILESCRVEGKKLNSKGLLEKFNVVTSMELISKLFLPGEVFELYTIVNDLSGYSKNAIEEVKKN